MNSATSTQTMVPANDFRALWDEIQSDVLAAVERVGKSGWYILGKEVRDFEIALAESWGLEHAIGCGNGMDAIEISLRAGGIQPGDKVLTTPLSAFATTMAINRAGGVPVFIDVDERGMLDLGLVEKLLERNGLIHWMVPVHLYGQCMDLGRLRQLRDRFALRIVEDCAQSIGAKFRREPCGTVGFAAATSFYPTKNLGAMGDGGALLTNDAMIAEAARKWRDYGQSEKYVHALPGLNSRLDELQAAILKDALLPRMAKYTAARMATAQAYRAGIQHPQLRPIPYAEGSEEVNHLYPVLVTGEREAFMKQMQAQGIGVGIHYPKLIPDQPAMQSIAHEVVGELKQARAFAMQEVSLPMHPHLQPDQVQRVIAACNAWKS